ncbi:type II secretion system protein [bacterium]|nr:type II secretion system protein [bacterium]
MNIEDKKVAFTLAEVLITLGIIGVVAALTLPTLINKYKERVLVERLKQTYSIFSQAYLRAVVDNGMPDNWDIGERNSMEGAEKLYDILTAYMKLGKSCKSEYGCFAQEYKTLDGNTYGYAPANHPMYVRGILANGVAFAMPSSGSGCELENDVYKNICSVLYVDLNGYSRPNQAGIDYFGFYITTKGIIPMGLQGWNGGANGYTCEKSGTSRGNGTGCTAWVLSHGNMDYLRQDISTDEE